MEVGFKIWFLGDGSRHNPYLKLMSRDLGPRDGFQTISRKFLRSFFGLFSSLNSQPMTLKNLKALFYPHHQSLNTLFLLPSLKNKKARVSSSNSLLKSPSLRSLQRSQANPGMWCLTNDNLSSLFPKTLFKR